MRPLTMLFALVIIYENDNVTIAAENLKTSVEYPKLMFQYEFNYEYMFNVTFCV